MIGSPPAAIFAFPEMLMPTREIPKQQWREFCDAFSRAHEGWRATMEVFSDNVVADVEAREMPLVGVTVDTKRRECVAIALGAPDFGHLTHFISEPASLRLKQTEDGADEGLSIESAGGITTLLHFHSPVRPELLEEVS